MKTMRAKALASLLAGFVTLAGFSGCHASSAAMFSESATISASSAPQDSASSTTQISQTSEAGTYVQDDMTELMPQTYAYFTDLRLSADVALDIKDTQAEIEQLEQLVNQQGVISSPFSGVISNVEAEVGTESTQTFCTIYDTSKGYLFACELPAAQASDCQTGLSAVIKQGDQTETAAITAISENAENDTVDITIQLTATDWKVGPADAEIVLSEQDYDLCLPNTAIHQDNQGDFVFAVEEKNTVLGTQNVLVRIPVTVLEVGQSQTSIEGAILPEDSIVVQSTRSLEAGSKVRVKNENA